MRLINTSKMSTTNQKGTNAIYTSKMSTTNQNGTNAINTSKMSTTAIKRVAMQ